MKRLRTLFAVAIAAGLTASPALADRPRDQDKAFEATKQGEYDIFCTEYCGAGHSVMLAKVVVESQSDFEKWLESAGVDEDMPLPEYGEQLLFEAGEKFETIGI